jgi:hypothetical protein
MDVINYLDNLKVNGVDHIRLKIRKYTDIIPILREYYSTKKWMVIEDKTRLEKVLKDSEDNLKQYDGLSFLNDPNIDEYTKFVMYVNHYEGEGFITVEKLKELDEVSLTEFTDDDIVRNSLITKILGKFDE